MPETKPFNPNVSDVFASGFDVHDWEDWLRLICWVETVEPQPGDGARHARKQTAAIVIPRSSLYELIRVLRHSAAHYRDVGPRPS
ncbi:MAG: hypothetical protein AB7K04_17865 [Pseudorhodoplanes sp.]